MKYIVIEVQCFADGNVSTPTYAFDDLQHANAKYYQVLSAASISTLPVHSAVIITNFGDWIKSEKFTHELQGFTGEE